METINRQERLEYIETQPPENPERYYLSEYVLSRHGVNVSDAAFEASFAQATTTNDSSIRMRLADFRHWKQGRTAQTIMEGEYTVGALLEAYGHSLEHQQARLEGLIPAVHEQFGRRLTQLSDSGHIPAVFQKRFEEYPAATHIRVGVTDSYFFPKAGAAYNPLNHTIYFRPWRSEKFIARYFTHEAFHALSGTTNKVDRESIWNSRTGLGTDVLTDRGYKENGKSRHRAINEGITEYLTNMVCLGLPGKITAQERGQRDSGVYNVEREIVKVLADRVGLDTLLNAYAEDYDPGQPASLQHTRRLMREIRKIYGPGFLHKVDKLDAADGPERALAYVKAADYLVDTKSRQKRVGRKFGHVLRRAA